MIQVLIPHQQPLVFIIEEQQQIQMFGGLQCQSYHIIKRLLCRSQSSLILVRESGVRIQGQHAKGIKHDWERIYVNLLDWITGKTEGNCQGCNKILKQYNYFDDQLPCLSEAQVKKRFNLDPLSRTILIAGFSKHLDNLFKELQAQVKKVCKDWRYHEGVEAVKSRQQTLQIQKKQKLGINEPIDVDRQEQIKKEEEI